MFDLDRTFSAAFCRVTAAGHCARMSHPDGEQARTARDRDDVGINQFSGSGLLDIEAALAADPDRYVEAASSLAAAAAISKAGAGADRCLRPLT